MEMLKTITIIFLVIFSSTFIACTKQKSDIYSVKKYWDIHMSELLNDMHINLLNTLRNKLGFWTVS